MSEMTNSAVGEILRKNFKTKKVANKNIRFPKNIFLKKDDIKKTLKLKLSRTSLLSNMQTNRSAFEAWALILKHWVKDWQDYKIILEWPRLSGNDKANPHYQRFLYRVFKFKKVFSWFEASSIQFLEDSLIDFTSGSKNKYLINVADCRRSNKLKNSRGNPINGERRIERQFASKWREKLENVADLESAKLDRQLPVGIFKNNVIEQNMVFSGKSSQIDLWGTNNSTKTLSIFELKLHNNISVGIISELFFYTMVMMDTLKPNYLFAFKTGCKATLDPKELLQGSKSNIKKIKSYMLAERLHPLISKELVLRLNNALRKKKIGSSFHFLKYSYNKDKIIECDLVW